MTNPINRCTSQPFWGKVVAAAGAGPQPVPYREADSNSLADAILTSLQPETLTAARDISIKMQSDAGVRAAVDSFHKNLPVDKMRCEFFSDQPAVWVYKKTLPKPIRLSKAAAQILGGHMCLDPKHLQW